MGLFSILPASLSTLETYLIRAFLVLAIITVGPWLLLIVYDVLLYLCRATIFELPYVGGRARGQDAPAAPSLTQRPDGHKRHISLPGVTRRSDDAEATGARRRSTISTPRTTYRAEE